ncbi:unnamed protein product, partial [marine sediment metagenome]
MKKLTDKTIDPIKALQAGNLTTAQAQQMYNGVLPIGDYKGVASILDLDKMVNQPLVLTEQQYISSILDGREEGYDRRTLTIPIDSPVAFGLSGSLTVPAGDLWYINAVQMYVPFDADAGV